MQSNGGYVVFQPIIENKCARVWLAKGGRKKFKVARIQLIIHSIRHGTDLTSIELDNFSIFNTKS